MPGRRGAVLNGRARGGITATHYEVLGVAADAGHDEIKRAYTALAMRYHPDRQVGQGGVSPATAEFRMREVNAAWEVLRNPARRATYDASLRGEQPVWERSGATPRAPRTSAVRPGESRVGPPGAAAPAPPSSAWALWPVAVLLVLVVAALAFTAWATQRDSDDRDGATSGGTEDVVAAPFAVGDCVVVAAAGGRLVPVAAPCGSPGAQELVSVTAVGRPCAPPAEPFDLQADRVRLCLRP